MERIQLDILDMRKVSRNGKKYVLVFQDAFTKFVVAEPIANESAETCAKAFLEKIVCIFGTPKTVLSDKGPQFTSKLNTSICEALNIRKLHTTSYHPAGNGLVERFNRTLLQMLSIAVDNHQDEWAAALPYCIFAYNQSVHASTQETPFFLTHGWDARVPEEPNFELDTTVPYVSEYRAQVLEKLKNAWNSAEKAIASAQTNQAKSFNRKAKEPGYKSGDLVLVHISTLKAGEGRKLAQPWQGPYRILEVKSPNAMIQLLGDPEAKVHRIHFNRLKHSNPTTTTRTGRDPLLEREEGDPNLEADLPSE